MLLPVEFSSMLFAKKLHCNQRRKYTNNPYFDHLAEVAGIASTAIDFHPEVDRGHFIAVCFLHDSMEDQDLTWSELAGHFGVVVADGVKWLTDCETGNRSTRKGLARLRLSDAPGWVQSIKVADMISNTSSISMHDKKFWEETYREEKRLLLDVLTRAAPYMIQLARQQLWLESLSN